MKRHYYISEDLDDLEAIEHELEQKGVSRPQIHVLSQNDAEVEQHHLHEVDSVLRKNIVDSTWLGVLLGLSIAVTVILVALLAGLTDMIGLVPFLFLAAVLLGFCVWEGGFIGIQEPNRRFARFHNALRSGKHVLFVDVGRNQEDSLESVVRMHPRLQTAGVGGGMPGWMVDTQNKWRRFIDIMP
jgi:hypothetical protein